MVGVGMTPHYGKSIEEGDYSVKFPDGHTMNVKICIQKSKVFRDDHGKEYPYIDEYAYFTHELHGITLTVYLKDYPQLLLTKLK